MTSPGGIVLKAESTILLHRLATRSLLLSCLLSSSLPRFLLPASIVSLVQNSYSNRSHDCTLASANNTLNQVSFTVSPFRYPSLNTSKYHRLPSLPLCLRCDCCYLLLYTVGMSGQGSQAGSERLFSIIYFDVKNEIVNSLSLLWPSLSIYLQMTY